MFGGHLSHVKITQVPLPGPPLLLPGQAREGEGSTGLLIWSITSSTRQTDLWGQIYTHFQPDDAARNTKNTRADTQTTLLTLHTFQTILDSFVLRGKHLSCWCFSNISGPVGAPHNFTVSTALLAPLWAEIRSLSYFAGLAGEYNYLPLMISALRLFTHLVPISSHAVRGDFENIANLQIH